MLNLKILLSILDVKVISKFLYLFLLMSLIPMLDCYLIILISRLMGEYLFISILLVLSLAGFFLARIMCRRNLLIIENNTKQHYYSEYYYNMYPGTLFISILLILPGFLATFIALICSLPIIRYKIGSSLSSYLKIDWKEIHEIINIID